MAVPIAAIVAAIIAKVQSSARKLKESQAEGQPQVQDTLGMRLEKEKQIMRLRR